MAKIEQANAATDANVATAFIERIIILVSIFVSLAQWISIKQKNERRYDRRAPSQRNNATVAKLAHRRLPAKARNFSLAMINR
jgi:hypothetical protein